MKVYVRAVLSACYDGGCGVVLRFDIGDGPYTSEKARFFVHASRDEARGFVVGDDVVCHIDFGDISPDEVRVRRESVDRIDSPEPFGVRLARAWAVLRGHA